MLRPVLVEASHGTSSGAGLTPVPTVTDTATNQLTDFITSPPQVHRKAHFRHQWWVDASAWEPVVLHGQLLLIMGTGKLFFIPLTLPNHFPIDSPVFCRLTLLIRYAFPSPCGPSPMAEAVANIVDLRQVEALM
jgi:hypothetical protein